MAYLGIDLGTSGIRALLVADDGAPVASAEAHYQASRPAPGWSEQDPADWIAALDKVMAELKAGQPQFAEVRGIGVAGHMHGAVLLDDQANVLRPCILWNDTRAHEEAAQLDADPDFHAISGNIVFPGFTAPKLEWVRRHEPAIHGQISKVLLPAAYLNHHLTGQYVGDLSDAAGTSWLDTGARRWSDTLLQASGMRADQMPRLVEGSATAAHLRPALAAKWGLGDDVVIAGGAADNAAAACGMGVREAGQGFVSLGTSGVVLAACDSYRPSPETALHSFCHAIPDTWYQMGVMLSATDCLNWLAALTGATPRDLAAGVEGPLQHPDTLRFFPYLAGERTPHNDAGIRGAFTGLSHATGRADMTRAIMTGVAFGLRDSFDAISAAGGRPDTLYAIGGGAASTYWLRVLATTLDTPLLRPVGGEFGAAMGAARLAITATTGAGPADVMTPPQDCEEIPPDADLVAAYDDAHAAFVAAYPAIRGAQ